MGGQVEHDKLVVALAGDVGVVARRIHVKPVGMVALFQIVAADDLVCLRVNGNELVFGLDGDVDEMGGGVVLTIAGFATQRNRSEFLVGGGVNDGIHPPDSSET